MCKIASVRMHLRDAGKHINSKRKNKLAKTSNKKGQAHLLNCAKCGKEILDKESSFCAYCGIALDAKPQNTTLTTAAGILTTIAATFSATVGTLGILYHQSYINYYTPLGYDTSGAIGFLLFATFALAAAAFGFTAGTLTLARKRYTLSLIGILVMLTSAIFTFIINWHFQYGYTEGTLLTGISIVAFSITSATFIHASKTEFTNTSQQKTNTTKIPSTQP